MTFIENIVGICGFILFVIVCILAMNAFFGKYKLQDQTMLRTDINNGPIIAEFHNVLSPLECDELIELGKKIVVESPIGFDNGKDRSRRSSSQAWIGRDHPIVGRVAQQIADIVNFPVENQEKFQLVRYRKGEQYMHHYDACNPEAPDYKACIENQSRFGGRKYTFLIYLNDIFEGGETDFPKVNVKVKPRKGAAVLFDNLEPNSRNIRDDALHAGLPPIGDEEKWIINVWIRDAKYG